MEELKKCIECRQKIDTGALLCVECGSYQDYRKYIKVWTPVFGFLLAFLAFIVSILPQITSAIFPSPPRFSAHLRSVSERSIAFDISNLGERRLIIDPVLKCVSASRLDEEIVDYEAPFEVWFTTVEAQSDRAITIAELGGSETATFVIPQDLNGSWLEHAAIFLPPEDDRVSGIEWRWSPGLSIKNTVFGAARDSKIPVYHIIGKDGLISLQPVSDIATFCQLTALDPVSGKEKSEGFAVWQIGNNLWQGGAASSLYTVLGSLIYTGGPGGLAETDPKLCNAESPPRICITED